MSGALGMGVCSICCKNFLDWGEILYFLRQKKKKIRPKVTTLPSLTSEDRGVPAASVCFFIYKMGAVVPPVEVVT